MKRLFLAIVCATLTLGLCTSAVFAIPEASKQFKDHYPALKEKADEAKCNVCHYGTSKKNKNDFGKALSEFIKKDNYKSDRVKSEADKVKAEFGEAFKKVEALKSKGGETFGERIKAGNLPGTPEKD